MRLTRTDRSLVDERWVSTTLAPETSAKLDNGHICRPGRPKAEPGSTSLSANASVRCEQSRPRLTAGVTSEFVASSLIASLSQRSPPVLDCIGFEVRGNAFRTAVAALDGVTMRSNDTP